MRNISTAKIDDFAIAMDRGVIIFSAILTEEALHQPGFRQSRRNIQDSIKKDLRHFPPFLGNGSCSVSPINADNRVLGLCFRWPRLNGLFIDI